LGITLQCHFILFHKDGDVSTKATDIINRLGDRDDRYTRSIIAYDIKLVQASPAWQYTAKGGGEVMQEKCYIKALIDINSFKSDGDFICPEKVHDDIYAVLKDIWPKCTINMQEIPPP
uniref:Uncharacterized protein n=1 Tax=Amphimedon queenslandica TaxID=400682 RepID=A0A1X7SR45_AMPQE